MHSSDSHNNYVEIDALDSLLYQKQQQSDQSENQQQQYAQYDMQQLDMALSSPIYENQAIIRRSESPIYTNTHSAQSQATSLYSQSQNLYSNIPSGISGNNSNAYANLPSSLHHNLVPASKKNFLVHVWINFLKLYALFQGLDYANIQGKAQYNVDELPLPPGKLAINSLICLMMLINFINNKDGPLIIHCEDVESTTSIIIRRQLIGLIHWNAKLFHCSGSESSHRRESIITSKIINIFIKRIHNNFFIATLLDKLSFIILIWLLTICRDITTTSSRIQHWFQTLIKNRTFLNHTTP
jgi:hypothetical protein